MNMKLNDVYKLDITEEMNPECSLKDDMVIIIDINFFLEWFIELLQRATFIFRPINHFHEP